MKEVVAEIYGAALKPRLCEQCGEWFRTMAKYRRRCDHCTTHCVKCNAPISTAGARAPQAKYCALCASKIISERRRAWQKTRTTEQRRLERVKK